MLYQNSGEGKAKKRDMAKCPKCGGNLIYQDEKIICDACGSKFKKRSKAKNADRQDRQKLSIEEANSWLLQNTIDPEYQSPTVNDELGTIVDNELRRTKHGEVLTTEIRYGGFYWFGDLIMALFFAGFAAAFISGAFLNAKTGNYLMIVIFITLSIPMIFGSFYECRKMRIHIKEKQKIKEEERKGVRPKTKLKPGTIAYRVALFTFMAFFLFMLTGFILSRLGIEISAASIKLIGIGTLIITGIAAFLIILRSIWRLIKDGWG